MLLAQDLNHHNPSTTTLAQTRSGKPKGSPRRRADILFRSGSKTLRIDDFDMPCQ
jgi:hypothetical protein